MKIVQCKEILKKKFDKCIQWIKQHPSVLVWIFLLGILMISQNYIIGLCFSPIEIFSMESIAQVLATSAEVVAGL